MSKETRSKYFWPASGITAADMALLHRARETLPERLPITQLLARAVRQTYARDAEAGAGSPGMLR